MILRHRLVRDVASAFQRAISLLMKSCKPATDGLAAGIMPFLRIVFRFRRIEHALEIVVQFLDDRLRRLRRRDHHLP